MNTKFYMADVLARAAGSGATLRIRRRCLVGNRTYVTGGESTWLETAASACAETDRPVLAESWDEVRVESRVAGIGDHRVPDILLLDGGKPVCAIEVLVSHEVDTEKAAMFQRNAIPWAEVVASEELCNRSTGWTIDQPLDPHASSISLDWRCEAHRTAYATHVRAAAVAERPPDRRTRLSARIVDVYLPNGTWRRLMYRVRAAYADGKLVRVALDRNAKLISQYAPTVRETESTFLSRVSPLVRFACRADIERIGRNAAIVDCGRWLKGDELSTVVDPRRVRRRYRYDSATRQWVSAPDAKQSALVFIESAIRGRRSIVQRSLVPRHE